MSIVIALGVTTPETSYSDMAAGSDPESVEATPAVNEKYSNHSCGSAQSHSYRGLPYADHNYGAPPPPTPPASPLPQTIIPRVELNGVACFRCGHDDDDDNSADSESSSEDTGESGWCCCSLTQDGFLIKCDSCRRLDRRKVGDAQRRKGDNVSVGESSAVESGDEEVSPSTVSYTATQHTPTSITLTVNRVKRSKSKKRKRATEKARSIPKAKKIKAFREGSRKSMRMKTLTTEASAVDENTAEGWETQIRQWTDQYEEALVNQYSADVQTVLQLHHASNRASDGKAAAGASMDNINRTELACNNTVIGSQMQLQLGRVTRVQKHRKILRAARDLEADTLIIEYRGKVMLKQQFEVNGHFFKKPYPFVLFYSKFNEVEMCIDARTFGNDARFIRRSCTPNAEVRHMISEGMIHLCIYAATRITKDSEVTIGFDYEFNSCTYKVDCACHKGNQSCPVQKHNLSPPEQVLQPSTMPPPETRRRKARRKELEGDSGGQPLLEPSAAKELQGSGVGANRGASDTEEVPCEELKPEEGVDPELDETRASCQSRRTREERKAEAVMQVFDNLEKKRKRSLPAQDKGQTGGEEPKEEGVDVGDSSSPVPGTASAQSNTVGVSTRRTSYVSEAPSADTDKAPAASKPPPTRSSKARPKSRMSRYRSSSSQRARRQRQALAQQAAEQGTGGSEEGAAGAPGAEVGTGEGTVTTGQPADVEGLGGSAPGASGSKASLRHPKTKKYLVTEWLNDKVSEKAECPPWRPLRITTDPTVLATTLNMLPGLSPSPLICTAPKHYVRFGSPFMPERRRRPLVVDSSYGSFKKRWIKQAQTESLSSVRFKDGTNSTPSNQSSTCSSLKAEMTAPFKKRKWKYMCEVSSPPPPMSSEGLLRPLSPITPPPAPACDPARPSLPVSCTLALGIAHTPHNGYCQPYSPLCSAPTSRCNTPLQFENISSPETSPVHRPKALSPELSLHSDVEGSAPSLLESPVQLDSTLGVQDGYSRGVTGLLPAPPTLADLPFGPRTGEAPLREQSFRKEFSLIYTCSPLNSHLGEGLGSRLPSDTCPSQSEGSFSPAESLFSCTGGQGILDEPGAGSLSPYPEPGPDSGTPSHAANAPQKKKVSLLEYRKRKQGVKESEGASSGLEPTGGARSSLYPPASPQGCLASPGHHPIPHVEDVSPPDHGPVCHHPATHSRSQESTSHWMVPTSVERLREGQGVLERVLRGSLKMDRVLKRADATDGCRDKEAVLQDTEDCEKHSLARPLTSPVASPQQYGLSPSLLPHQSLLTEVHQKTETPAIMQQTPSSPFCGPYSPTALSPVQSYYTHVASHQPLTQDTLQQHLSNPAPSYASQVSSTTVTSSLDSPLCGPSRKTGGTPQHLQHHHQLVSAAKASGTESSHFYSASLLSSSPPGLRPTLPMSPCLTQNNPKMDTPRMSQQPGLRTLSPESPVQAALSVGKLLLSSSSSSSQHCAQQGTSGVRTQSGGY